MDKKRKMEMENENYTSEKEFNKIRDALSEKITCFDQLEVKLQDVICKLVISKIKVKSILIEA